MGRNRGEIGGGGREREIGGGGRNRGDKIGFFCVQ